MKTGWIWIALLASATYLHGAAFKEGKTVMDSKCTVDITKMTWGIKNGTTDRVIGTASLYVGVEDVYDAVTLVFDVYARKSTNSAPAVAGAPFSKPDKIDTIEVKFDFRSYGYTSKRNYFEGEFCSDFPKRAEAGRLVLANVKLKDESVVYKTTFNISASMIRSLFKLAEPKSEAKPR
jgi:hypothetical protein